MKLTKTKGRKFCLSAVCMLLLMFCWERGRGEVYSRVTYTPTTERIELFPSGIMSYHFSKTNIVIVTTNSVHQLSIRKSKANTQNYDVVQQKRIPRPARGFKGYCADHGYVTGVADRNNIVIIPLDTFETEPESVIESTNTIAIASVPTGFLSLDQSGQINLIAKSPTDANWFAKSVINLSANLKLPNGQTATIIAGAILYTSGKSAYCVLKEQIGNGLEIREEVFKIDFIAGANEWTSATESWMASAFSLTNKLESIHLANGFLYTKEGSSWDLLAPGSPRQVVVGDRARFSDALNLGQIGQGVFLSNNDVWEQVNPKQVRRIESDGRLVGYAFIPLNGSFTGYSLAGDVNEIRIAGLAGNKLQIVGIFGGNRSNGVQAIAGSDLGWVALCRHDKDVSSIVSVPELGSLISDKIYQGLLERPSPYPALYLSLTDGRFVSGQGAALINGSLYVDDGWIGSGFTSNLEVRKVELDENLCPKGPAVEGKVETSTRKSFIHDQISNQLYVNGKLVSSDNGSLLSKEVPEELLEIKALGFASLFWWLDTSGYQNICRAGKFVRHAATDSSFEYGCVLGTIDLGITNCSSIFPKAPSGLFGDDLAVFVDGGLILLKLKDGNVSATSLPNTGRTRFLLKRFSILDLDSNATIGGGSIDSGGRFGDLYLTDLCSRDRFNFPGGRPSLSSRYIQRNEHFVNHMFTLPRSKGIYFMDGAELKEVGVDFFRELGLYYVISQNKRYGDLENFRVVNEMGAVRSYQLWSDLQKDESVFTRADISSFSVDSTELLKLPMLRVTSDLWKLGTNGFVTSSENGLWWFDKGNEGWKFKFAAVDGLSGVTSSDEIICIWTSNEFVLSDLDSRRDVGEYDVSLRSMASEGLQAVFPLGPHLGLLFKGGAMAFAGIDSFGRIALSERFCPRYGDGDFVSPDYDGFRLAFSTVNGGHYLVNPGNLNQEFGWYRDCGAAVKDGYFECRILGVPNSIVYVESSIDGKNWGLNGEVRLDSEGFGLYKVPVGTADIRLFKVRM